MQPRDLIVSARRTIGKGRGKPRQADLKRALSSAYYAIFHSLCWNCADCFIGKTHQFRNQSAWQQAYRAIEHGHAKSQCKNKSIMEKFPETIQNFADTFLILQEKRHMADYDPMSKFTRHEVLTTIEVAEKMIRVLQASSIKDKRAFAVWIAMKKRTNPIL